MTYTSTEIVSLIFKMFHITFLQRVFRPWRGEVLHKWYLLRLS